MSRDLLGLVISFAYVGAVLLLGEGLRRYARWPAERTRKLVHVLAGFWVFPVIAVFETAWVAVLPALAFIGINYLSLRRRLFRSVHEEDTGWGTVAFPLAFVLLIPLLWDRRPLLPAALMPLVVADPAAALVGGRWGRLRYGWPGALRSLEGSLTMLVVSVLTVAASLAVLDGLAVSQAVRAGLVVAAWATLAEGITARGWDNLTVPLVSAAVLVWLMG